MKLLILVLACDNSPFKEINDCQKSTWDSVEVPDVETWFYYGNNNNEYRLSGKNIYCPCSDEYNMMHWRMKLAIDYLWDRPWDYIFRTNTSTYVRKDRIKNYIEKLGNKKKIYEGVPGGGYISGTGILMSRDVVDVLKNNIDIYPTDSEDAYIGVTLARCGIVENDSGLKRLQYNFKEDSILQADYYRCKSEIMMDGTFGYNNLDRTYDIKAMRNLFENLK